MDLIVGSVPGAGADDAAVELACANAMLGAVARGELGETVRIYRPPAPTAAFGRRDVRLPGIGDAVGAARDAGFSPCLRPTGGRAALYTERSVVVDHVCPDLEWPSRLEDRFEQNGELWVSLLRGLGVEARLGEVPGEFCPGAHSINARGVVKLVGTAQRMVRGAWLFSAVLVVDDAELLRSVLPEVYGSLGLPLDVSSVGSVAKETEAVDLTDVEAAVVEAYRARYDCAVTDLPPALVERAWRAAPDFQL